MIAFLEKFSLAKQLLIDNYSTVIFYIFSLLKLRFDVALIVTHKKR